MKKTIFTLFLSASAAIGACQAPGWNFQPSTTPDFSNLNYASDDLEGHTLDIYLPKDGKERHPLVVVIYGSAWFANNMKVPAYETLGKALTEAGYAVASINHRSSTEAKYPSQIQDVKGAVRYLRANAEKFGLDTSFVGITGYSSGGHLSAMAGVTNDMKTRKIGSTEIDIEGSVGGNTEQSSRVDAVVDWFGPIDMLHMEDCTGVKDEHSPEAVLMGTSPASNPEMTQLISPITYISESSAPMLVIHGMADNVVPFCQGETFSSALAREGRLEKFIEVENGGHGPVTINAYTLKEMTDFFDKKRK